MVREHQLVLFLCTGNFYRSRYAEALFNYEAPIRGLQWRAHSAGFRPHLATEDLSHYVEEQLATRGISADHTRQLPGKVTVEELTEAALVIALYESEHRPMMREQFPRWTQRVHYWDVPDIDELTPDHALPLIDAKVESLIDDLGRGHALGQTRDVLVEF